MLWKYCTQAHCNALLLSLDLFAGMGFSPQKQIQTLYTLSNHAQAHYRKATVSKRGGGARTLYIPDDLLKHVQRLLLKQVLEPLPVSRYAMAYRPATGIRDHAAIHAGQRKVLRLDIAHFFDHITFAMVYRHAFPGTLYPPALRTLFANLCCYRDALPQGAPTSPAVSNLVLRPFDAHMGEWCEKRGIFYSRYCDDMVFSGDFDARLILSKVSGFLNDMGFSLNTQKTRCMDENHRQCVTGLTVNEQPRAQKEYRRRLRQEVHYCSTYGVAEHLRHADVPVGDNPALQAAYLQSLLGKINFVLHIHPEDAPMAALRTEVLRLLGAHAPASYK